MARLAAASLLPRAMPRAAALAAVLLGAGAALAQVPVDQEVLGRIRGWVGQLHADIPAAARIEVEPGSIDPRLKLAPCRRVEPRWPEQAATGVPLRVALRCVEGDKPWQVWLPVQVRLFAPAAVPARPLPAGTVLGAADLSLAEVDWAARPQLPFARIDDLIGRTLARALPQGHALRAGDLRERQWFASGEDVQLLARGAGFTVAGVAQALGPGIEGRLVRVRTESGRVLQAMPTGQRRVEVAL